MNDRSSRSHPAAAPTILEPSVAIVLDRYGHLFPGHEDAFLDRLDGFAERPSLTAMTAPNALTPLGAAGFSRGKRD